ncbi:Vacuolar protein 8, partial [Mortierella alpina]
MAIRAGGFDQKGRTDFFKGAAMRYTKILAYARDDVDKRHFVATGALLMATERGKCVDAVGQDVLKVVFRLMEKNGHLMREGASVVLIRLASNDTNKVLIIELDGLNLLRNLLLSAAGTQKLRQNYVAAIRKLVMKDSVAQVVLQDKETLAAIVKLAQDDELETQAQALETLRLLSETEGFTEAAVHAEVLPTVLCLIEYRKEDFGMRCLATLDDMTSSKSSLDRSTQPRPDISGTVKTLLNSTDAQVIGAALLVLMKFALEERYRQEIVSAGCLAPLLKQLKSRSLQIVNSVIGVIAVLAKTSGCNDQPIIESRCLERLIELLDPKKSLISRGDESRFYIIMIFRLLLVREAELRPRMLQMGVLDTMIHLAQSTTTEMWILIAQFLARLTDKPANVTPFINNWATPAAGLRGYLVRSLESDEETHSKFAFQIIMRLAADPALRRLIAQAGRIRAAVQCMLGSLQAMATNNKLPQETRMAATEELEA